MDIVYCFTSYYIHMKLNVLSRECPSIVRADIQVNVLKVVLQMLVM